MIFSVLITNYNNASYIIECLQSVINQTYQKFEIIIVDDCSEDDSIDKINSFAQGDTRIKLYQNDKNYGAGYSKKRCIDLAVGDICGFLDSDDALTADAIDVMINMHNQHVDASIVYSTHYLCDDKLVVKQVSPHIQKQPKGVSVIEEVHISHFVTFKRNLYLGTKGMNPKYIRAVDHDLYFLLEDVGTIEFINQPLYYYRRHSNNISLNENKFKAEYWDWIIRHDHATRKGFNLEEQYMKKRSKLRFMPGRFGDFLEKIYKLYIRVKF